jgi:hypothetical protein
MHPCVAVHQGTWLWWQYVGVALLHRQPYLIYRLSKPPPDSAPASGTAQVASGIANRPRLTAFPFQKDTTSIE